MDLHIGDNLLSVAGSFIQIHRYGVSLSIRTRRDDLDRV
jgi:hypothetical protein